MILILIVLIQLLIVLRKDNQKHEWYQPEFKSPLYPFVQIFGIIAGGTLVYLMGSKAIIGALAAIVLGLSTYKIYGEKNYKSLETTSLESE